MAHQQPSPAVTWHLEYRVTRCVGSAARAAHPRHRHEPTWPTKLSYKYSSKVLNPFTTTRYLPSDIIITHLILESLQFGAQGLKFYEMSFPFSSRNEFIMLLQNLQVSKWIEIASIFSLIFCLKSFYEFVKTQLQSKPTSSLT